MAGSRRDVRGQSSLVGMALIIGFSIAVAASIVIIGGVAISDVQQTSQTEQAAVAMSQLDSRASTVALGDSESKQIQLGGNSNGQVEVDADAGQITLLAVNDTSSKTIANETFGTVYYRSGSTTIAYQGGGTWRQDGGGSVMISPPQYHYRDNTLTFPIVQVRGDEWSSSPSNPITVKSGEREQLFPSGPDQNPLDEGHVHVRVESEFHQGWKTFFETRTEGTVTHDPEDQTVTVNLTVPYTESFENTVAATSDESDAIEEIGNAEIERPWADGVDRPSVSPKVEAQISECGNGGCTDLETAGSTLENGTYYHDGDVTLDETNYDTSDGDIHVVVEGDLEFHGTGGGPPGTAHHQIDGDGMVRFYVNGSVRISGNTGVNSGGDASNLLVMIHSDGGDVATSKGTPQFTGLIYAPNASLTVRGNANFVGAAVVYDADARGNANVEHRDVGDVGLDFDPIDNITFLHVSKNPVEFESG